MEFLNLNQIAFAGLYTGEAYISVTCEVYDYNIITTILNNINVTKLHTYHDNIYNEEHQTNPVQLTKEIYSVIRR